MVAKDGKKGADNPKNFKALNLNSKALRGTSKELKSLTKKLEGSFTPLSKSLGSLTKAITKLDASAKKLINKKVVLPKPPKPLPAPKPPKPPKTPITPDPKPKPKDGKGKEEGGKEPARAGLAAGMGVAIMGKLTGAIMGLYDVQSNMAKTFTRTGNMNMIGFGKVGKTFNAAGLSMADQFATYGEIFDNGIGGYTRSLGSYTDGLSQPKAMSLQRDTLNQYKNLGLDTKALAGIMGHNSQVIGGSTAKTMALADTMAGLGEAYGINTNKLVASIANLSETFMKSAAVFGADTAQAGQEAIANIIAKMGPAQASNVEALGRTLLSGTKEASITAMKLGVSMEALNSKNSAEVEQALMQGLASLNTATQTGGSADAGLWVGDITKALGGNDQMLSLARHAGNLTQKQIDVSLNAMAANAVAADAKANIDQMITDSIKAILPIIETLVTPLSWIAKAVGAMSGTITAILAIMMVRKAAGAMKSAGTKFKKGAEGMGVKAQKTVDDMAMKGNARFQPAAGGNFVNNAAGKAGVLGGKTKLVGGSMGQKATLKIAQGQMKASKVGAKLVGKLAMKTGTKLMFRSVGMLLGPIGLLLGFLPDILGMFGISLFGDSEADKDRKKTVELLAKPSKQETQLAGIAQMLTQSNIYAEKANLTSEATLTATKDNKVDPDAPPPASQTIDNLPPTENKST